MIQVTSLLGFFALVVPEILIMSVRTSSIRANYGEVQHA